MNYIPENVSNYSWLQNPLDTNVSDLPDSISAIENLQEQLIDVQADSTYRLCFQKESLSAFWIRVNKEKPILGSAALKMLLPFATTYLCEAGFSALTFVKTKARNRLMPEHDLRCSLSNTTPCFETLARSMQGQGSH
jgi:hypothetical protein